MSLALFLFSSGISAVLVQDLDTIDPKPPILGSDITRVTINVGPDGCYDCAIRITIFNPVVIINYNKQAENGLQSRSFENGMD